MSLVNVELKTGIPEVSAISIIIVDVVTDHVFLLYIYIYIVMFYVCVWDYRRGMDWWMALLTTYTRHLELQVIKALLLISTLYE
jgi:hypothetical protein